MPGMAATPLSWTRLRDLTRGVRRGVLRRRRLLAVLFAVAAVAAGVRTAMPPEPATVDVVVATRALPAGAVLEEDDVTVVAWPPDAAPGAVVADPVGAALAGAVGRGEPITTARLLGRSAADAQPGHTAVPVRLSDAAQAGLLEVGMRIDLLATDPKAGSSRTVAPDTTVLAMPAPPEGVAGGAVGRVVVLAVPDALVETVTAATVSAYVTFAWSAV